ncbi:MAG: hypothetical protein ACRC6V_03145 [Bacteroidales bacterium]
MKKLIAAVVTLITVTGCSSVPTPYSTEVENTCYNIGYTLAHDESDKVAASKLIFKAENQPGFDKDQCIALGRQGYDDTKQTIQQEEADSIDWANVGKTTLQVVAVVLVAAGEAAAKQEAANQEAHRQFVESHNRQVEMQNAVHNALDQRGYR